MAFAATALKDMLKVSIKPRHDSIPDQYSRIFMVKLFLIGSVITGLSWYADSINCIVPGSHGVNGGFVTSTCWIQGVYVYRELAKRLDDVAYFGIPKDIDRDGYMKNSPSKELCSMVAKLKDGKLISPDANCTPLEKTFYLQYQYMPFLLAALAILFYLPYQYFKTVNADLISLKEEVKSEEANAGKIAKHYFDNRSNPNRNNRFRILLNILIKIFYVLSNVVSFIILNNAMNGDFKSYGVNWTNWARLPNTIAYDYMGERDHPKPGNLLLPPFGYCEVYSSSKDIKNTVNNKHKYVCELSQYVLYQYVFMLLWFALVFGIVASLLGLVMLLVNYIVGIFGMKSNDGNRRILKLLSFRELEYLEYIKKKDIGLFGEVLQELKKIKLGTQDSNAPPQTMESTKAPLFEDQYKKKPEYDDYD